LPYFAKGITYSPPNAQLRAANASVPPPENPFAFNGTGPLHVSHPNFAQVFASYVNGAMEESGIAEQEDFASGKLLGRQYAPLTISYPDEERSSSQAFLKQALRNGNENLRLYSHTLAKQVIFDNTLTAKAVELQTSSYGNTKSFRLNTTREIILLAGAFYSPNS
jgi:choline dehydrogenase